MSLYRTLIACTLALFLAACGGATLHKTDTTGWLDLRAGAADYDISGKWSTANSWSGNWGDANFIQDGAKFYGQLGNYTVDGSSNGNYLYLALSSGSRVYYTALLKREADGSYAGKVAQDFIIDGPSADTAGYQIMILQRPKLPAAKPGTMPLSR
jgi:hypothetical protein